MSEINLKDFVQKVNVECGRHDLPPLGKVPPYYNLLTKERLYMNEVKPLMEVGHQFTILKYPERFRTYYFPDGTMATFYDIVKVLVRPSGTHRLEDKNGRKFIVRAGWNYIEFDADDWTF